MTETARFREVRDSNGRVYRIGESDRDIMGRPRWTMVFFPWLGMLGISVAEYAFGAAESTLRESQGWSETGLFWMLGVWVAFQAAVAYPAGKLRESGKLSARAAMFLGAVGAFIGYLSLAHAPSEFLAFVGFGAFGGIGAGLVYATCVNMVGKWYPERKGGKTGLVNGAFAYGSVPFVYIFTQFMAPDNFRGVIDAVGFYVLAVVAVAGFFFKDPPKNWWPEHVDPLAKIQDKRAARSLLKNPPADRQYTPMEAVRTGILPMMWVCLLMTSGINIFGIAFQVPFGEHLGFAGVIAATGASLKAIVNGTGRGVIGWISDRYGRRNTLVLVCVVLGLAQFGVLGTGYLGSAPLFLLFSMISGFGGGAIFPLFAAMTADYFGENNNASNYGLVYSGKVLSGLFGSGVGSVIVAVWGFPGAFITAGTIGLLAGGLALLLRRPGGGSRVVAQVDPNLAGVSR